MHFASLYKLRKGGVMYMKKINSDEYKNNDPNINSGCDSGAVACM